MRCPLTDHRDLTEGSPPGGLTEYERVQATPQFAELRDRFRKFVFPWTIFFLLWYFLYVLLAAFAPGFMSTKVFGNINLGFIFGGLQFVSTFGITMLYVRWASREFDPRADVIRDEMERAGA
ncbi:MAG: DUF485 domain-containing protein [Austwickia sp.]|jgi:uncharacterized membrane protein (DUF485 family)|nr:MAG: DUF485 domain-containing protein [Austwickia sp.]